MGFASLVRALGLSRANKRADSIANELAREHAKRGYAALDRGDRIDAYFHFRCAFEVAAKPDRDVLDELAELQQEFRDWHGARAVAEVRESKGWLTRVELGGESGSCESCQEVGALLVRRGQLSPEALLEAEKLSCADGYSLKDTLVERGYTTERAVVQALGDALELPSVDVGEFIVEPDVLKLVPADIAYDFVVIPVDRVAKVAIIAMAVPCTETVDYFTALTGLRIEPVVGGRNAILASLREHYGAPSPILAN